MMKRHLIPILTMLALIPMSFAGAAETGKPRSARSSLALTPASLELLGKPGQGLMQPFRVANNTQATVTLRAEAFDLLVRSGKAEWVAAGELPGSLAAAVTISPLEQDVMPGAVGKFDVTFSVPVQTDIRGVMIRFVSVEGAEKRKLGMGMALASLVTFTLSDDVRVEPHALVVVPSTRSRNLTFVQPLRNVGREPFYAKGAIAILDGAGRLVGKLDIKRACFLPNRRATLELEYPEQLPPGSYRALLTLQYRDGVLTTEAPFDIR
ncbi:MAG TPA: hypothetical protein VMT00_00635 [Thermoanaerobaculia bacterium]|nr:hypothetical protein [Thermoanaerobaculia bacterium]